MDCRRRSAVDDDRSRRIRLAVDDDRRRGRWAVDDDRSHIAFYQAQVNESLARIDNNLRSIDKNLRSIRRMRMSSATIPASSSSLLSFASRNHKQPAFVDDYPLLQLQLRWRDPPPAHTVRNHPVAVFSDSPPLKQAISRSDLLTRPVSRVADCSDSAFNSFREQTKAHNSIPPTFSHFRNVTDLELDIEQIRDPQQPQHNLPLLLPQHSTCDSSSVERNSALEIAEQYHPKGSFEPPSSSTTTAADDSNHRSYCDMRACTRLSSPECSASREHSVLGPISSSSRRPDVVVVPGLNALSDIQSQTHAPPARPTLRPPPNSSSSSLLPSSHDQSHDLKLLQRDFVPDTTLPSIPLSFGNLMPDLTLMCDLLNSNHRSSGDRDHDHARDRDIEHRTQCSRVNPFLRIVSPRKISTATNQKSGYDIIAQFMIGFILPGMPIANLLFKIYGRTSTGIEIDDEELARFVEHVDEDNNGIITFEEWRDSLLLYPHEATIENIYHYWKRVCLVDIGEQAVIPEGINKHVNVSKYLIAGGVAGAASRTSTAPLDRLKVVMHVHTKSAKIIPAIKDIWREGRFLGFFREKRDIGAYEPEADSIVQKLVRKLFDEVPQRITIFWNAMVQVHVKNHFLELVDDYWPRRTAFKIFDPGGLIIIFTFILLPITSLDGVELF